MVFIRYTLKKQLVVLLRSEPMIRSLHVKLTPE